VGFNHFKIRQYPGSQLEQFYTGFSICKANDAILTIFNHCHFAYFAHYNILMQMFNESRSFISPGSGNLKI